MPKFRADFVVKCSLVLADEAPLMIVGADPAIEITFRNAAPDAEGHVPELVAEVVGDCDSIEDASVQFRELLADQVDVISFATHSTFMIDQCLRVLDWEPFQKIRRIRPAQKFDPLHPPDPDLRRELMATIQAIIRSRPERHVMRAMRYFRQGVIETELSDQFLRFWAVLEVIAEASKEVERVPILCPRCQKSLFCRECQEAPTRRPMATQAVRQLLGKINAQGEQLFKLLLDTRNHLTHGGSIESLQAKIGVTLDQAVNNAAAAAWHAILHAMPPLEGQPQFGNRGGDFVHRELVVSADITFEYTGDSAHPAEEQIPKPQIAVKTKFRRPDDDQTVTR
jgi:hypothetical protein